MCYSLGFELYIELDILRDGNDQLLNNLQEGVFIVEHKTGKVLFKNKAARKLKRTAPLLGEAGTMFDNTTQSFAPINMEIFQPFENKSGCNHSSEDLVDQLKACNNYQSMDQIIELQH